MKNIDNLFDDDTYTYPDGSDEIGFDELPTQVQISARERAASRLDSFEAAMDRHAAELGERDPTVHWTERLAHQLDRDAEEIAEGFEPVDLVDLMENGVLDIV